MIKIKKIETEQMANQCDVLLNKLIFEESKYDQNVNNTFMAANFYKNKYLNDNNVLFLAYSNDIPVGYIFGYLKLESGDLVCNSEGHINSLYVFDEYRNQGIAKLLLKEFYEWCKDKNITIVGIKVYAKNKNAYDLYKNQGFEIETYGMKKNL